MSICRLRVERRGDDFLIVIPRKIIESWGLKEGSEVELVPVRSDHESRDSEISSLACLIGLWREEEERLRAIIAALGTSSEVRLRANEKLAEIFATIRDHEEEMARLQEEGQTSAE